MTSFRLTKRWEKKFVLSQFKNGDWKELVEVKVGYLDTKPANWKEIRPFSAEKEVKTFALLEAQAGGLYRSIGLVSVIFYFSKILNC